MPPPAGCHPCLPQDLLAKLKSEPALSASDSSIFTPEFEGFRLAALQLSSDRTWHAEAEVVYESTIPIVDLPGEPTEQIMKNIYHFRPGDKKTFLHSAAHRRDVLLAYETIRMGAFVNRKDREGVTPLFCALEHIFLLDMSRRIISQPGLLHQLPAFLRNMIGPNSEDETSNMIDCIVRIATLLIEQHADVNDGAFEYTPLSLAAEAGQWTLVKLLLQHGAARTGPEALKFASPAEKIRFSSILDQTDVVNPRPARPCPCWSGKPLSECHDASQQPYPDHFLCVCGKRRTYGSCCGKRGIEIKEKWDRRHEQITPVQAYKMRMPDIAPELQADYVTGWGLCQELLANSDKRRLKEFLESEEHKKFVIDHIWASGRKDEIDPAFLYALTHLDFFARPWDGLVSKIDWQSRMDDWNEAVDNYMLKYGDPRPRFEIELQAKIGLHGGPLYRRCEAKGCKNVEQRDVDKMKCCSGCKLIFYCGRTCQTKGWRKHKTDCESKTHRVQLLHSQWTLEQIVADLQASIARSAFAPGRLSNLEEGIRRLTL